MAKGSMASSMRDYLRPGKDRQPSQPLPSVKTDLSTLPSDGATVVWFGHSSYLLKIAVKTILVDPVFSGNASPVAFFGKNYPGSNVYGVVDMPEIDILLLTHDHYDHLDYKTISQLRPKVKQVVTSLGVGAHLERWDYSPEMITELAWHEEAQLEGSLRFTALPARHFSGRLFKRGQTLWSSFVLDGPGYKLYLGGDSGYDTHFREIGEKYGPFDLALLECGQYNQNWPYIHMMPEETAQAALDLRAKVLLPVHWGKFTLALHPWYEPIERVSLRAQELGLPLVTPMIGQPFTIGENLPGNAWWR
ncbi:MBL fold metallo-hydrolase [Persicitalea jodogahamensis]|uniref:MBL fold metallo-hydrolase n=2 Tax=Persicitalea jodogahamensis TaxID=402147 RepID=A0A8J3D2G3_9BACT|nr:MBL fold metallo-hydrolase [Persicitalea jodogahamensis]